MQLRLVILALAFGAVSSAGVTNVAGAAFTEPDECTTLNCELRLGPVKAELPDASFTTRGFNGGLPGPTLRVKAGETLNVTLINLLQVTLSRLLAHAATASHATRLFPPPRRIPRPPPPFLLPGVARARAERGQRRRHRDERVPHAQHDEPAHARAPRFECVARRRHLLRGAEAGGMEEEPRAACLFARPRLDRAARVTAEPPHHSPSASKRVTARLTVPLAVVALKVEPEHTGTYSFTVPSYHMGGTHWYHPHHHGATALQAGGGAAGLLIVEDADDEARAAPPPPPGGPCCDVSWTSSCVCLAGARRDRQHARA